MEMIRTTVILSLIIIFIQSCTSGKAPSKEEIVGTWISADGATMEFKSDGSFLGRRLPQGITNSQEIGHFDASGKWSIGASKKSWDQQPWYILLKFDNLPTEYISSTSLIVSGSNFMENAPPWQNLFFWVDEEGGERYEFNKE